MYRVNKSGAFNVPFGHKKKLKIIDQKNFELIKEFFSGSKAIVKNDDYLKILDEAKPNDFVFIDPPYHDTFVDYQKGSFNEEDQTILKNKLTELDKKGVQWILCNNNTDFIDKLYKNKNFKKLRVSANRNVSSDGNNRKKSAEEIFVYNFKTNKSKKEGEHND